MIHHAYGPALFLHLAASMRLLLLSALLATPALATGERVVVSPASSPLKDSVCISMSCVTAGPKDAVVATRTTGATLEVTVTMANGQKRLTHVMKLNEHGQLGSTDLVHATALVLQAIETGPVQGDAPPAPPKKALAHKKSKRLRLIAHR